MPEADSIDRILEQWARERPELDTSGFAAVGRVLALARRLERRVSDALAPLGLSLWAFDVLATLRRQGPPFRLTPTALSRATLLTTGAMTNRLDRLEAAGLLRREPDPSDRRGLRVSLTPAGLELVDRALEVRLAEANAALAELPETGRRALTRHLRSWLLALERGG